MFFSVGDLIRRDLKRVVDIGLKKKVTSKAQHAILIKDYHDKYLELFTCGSICFKNEN